MTAALKRMHLQEVVVLNDDTGTMVGLVGKRVIPILVRDDGRPMLESINMVKYQRLATSSVPLFRPPNAPLPPAIPGVAQAQR